MKIAAIWGEQDGITPASSEFAKKLTKGSQENPDRFSWKLIKGGHVLHDDEPEEVLKNMKEIFGNWFE